MHVLITSPLGKSQEYDVSAVSGFNSQGEFSILSNHTHFLTIISGQVKLFPEALFGKKIEPIVVDIGTGVLRCVDGRDDLYGQIVTVDDMTAKLATLYANTLAHEAEKADALLSKSTGTAPLSPSSPVSPATQPS